MLNLQTAIPLSQAISAVRAALFDLRSDPRGAKILATEADIRAAMARSRRPVPSPIDFDIAVEHLKDTLQISSVVSSDGTEYSLTPKGYHLEEDSRLPWWRRGDALDGLGKALALIALLLPVSGAILRGFAFYFGPHLTVPSSRLAWSASPAQLIATGFLGLLLPTLTFAVIGILMFWTANRGWYGRLASTGGGLIERLPGFLILLVAVAAVFVVVFAVDWPGQLVSIIAGLLTGFLGSAIARRPAPLKLSHFWPVILIGVFASAASSGLRGAMPGVQTGDYVFASSAGLADGKYVELGDFDSFLYLLDCRSKGQVLAVPQATVLSIRVSDAIAPDTPSIFDTVFRHKRFVVGFRPPC